MLFFRLDYEETSYQTWDAEERIAVRALLLWNIYLNRDSWWRSYSRFSPRSTDLYGIEIILLSLSSKIQ